MYESGPCAMNSASPLTARCHWGRSAQACKWTPVLALRTSRSEPRQVHQRPGDDTATASLGAAVRNDAEPLHPHAADGAEPRRPRLEGRPRSLASTGSLATRASTDRIPGHRSASSRRKKRRAPTTRALRSYASTDRTRLAGSNRRRRSPSQDRAGPARIYRRSRAPRPRGSSSRSGADVAASSDSVDAEHPSQDQAHADHDAEDRRNPNAGHRCPAAPQPDGSLTERRPLSLDDEAVDRHAVPEHGTGAADDPAADGDKQPVHIHRAPLHGRRGHSAALTAREPQRSSPTFVRTVARRPLSR